MLTVDANVILRYLLNDHPNMAQEARERLKQEPYCIKCEVLVEVVYVLEKVYKTERDEIGRSVLDLMDTENICMESEDTVRCAVETYKTSSLDFIDCMLYAYQMIDGEKIFTFDKPLKKILER